MQRQQLALFLFVIIICGCNSSPTADTAIQKRMIPDSTPYIAGLVEATHDTVHHYPEVVVGYMTDVVWDTDNWEHPSILRNYPELYNPTLWTQVVKTSQYFGFGYEPEIEANVTVTGPLNHPGQKAVQFSSIGNGVYGDVDYQLELIAGEHYKLKVILDERSYIARTIIPEDVKIHIPDSIGIKVRYAFYGDGTPREESITRYPIVHPYPDHEFLTVRQWNSSMDRELLLLEPGEEFKFNDRSPYLRAGFYGIAMTAQKKDTLTLNWGQNLNKSKEEVWNKVEYWLRFSFFSNGIGYMFHPAYNIFSLDGEEYDSKINTPFAENLADRDTTYLFDISTLRKLGPDGKILHADSLDAIGFFGGYFSIYRRTTVYPIRNFDLDSVLTAHGYE